MRKLSILIALMILAGFVIFASTRKDSRDETNNHKERTVKIDGESGREYGNVSNSEKLSAYNLATDFVIKSLKEPATAEFPGTKEKLKHIEYLGNKKYRIDSWVDSRDTYGAMTRRSFNCILKMKGSSIIKEKFTIEEYGYIPK